VARHYSDRVVSSCSSLPHPVSLPAFTAFVIAFHLLSLHLWLLLFLKSGCSLSHEALPLSLLLASSHPYLVAHLVGSISTRSRIRRATRLKKTR
jgi:hypothetical protein